MINKVEDLGENIIDYLRSGPIPACLGMVLVTTEGEGDDFVVRVTPHGLIGPLSELINKLVCELSQHAPNDGFIEEIVANYVRSMPKEVKSDA